MVRKSKKDKELMFSTKFLNLEGNHSTAAISTDAVASDLNKKDINGIPVIPRISINTRISDCSDNIDLCFSIKPLSYDDITSPEDVENVRDKYERQLENARFKAQTIKDSMQEILDFLDETKGSFESQMEDRLAYTAEQYKKAQEEKSTQK